MDDHQLVFKLSSIFLQYPNKDWFQNEEIEKLIFQLEDLTIRRLLMKFFNYTKEVDFYELCENYSQTFDFSDNAPLYLTYKKYGDSPERGPALVKLKQEFANNDYFVKDDELPDFYPLVLEFASLREGDEANHILMKHKEAIDVVETHLAEIDSPYQFVVKASNAIIRERLKKRKVS